jgi:peroxiredoxin family protein/TusA-related sulfurtransferase
VLDFRGKQCPEPIVLLAQAARTAKAALVVLADDEAFPADVRSWCRSAGATLEDFSQEGTVFRARIRPRGIAAAAPTTAAARTAETAPPPAPSTPADPSALAIASLPKATTTALAPVSGGTQITLDLRALQAPELGRMLDGLGSLPAGTSALVSLGNSAALQETVRWSAAAGHELLAFDPTTLEARLKLAGPRAASLVAATLSPDEALGFVRANDAPDCALLVLSDDLEALLAALLVANGAAAQGLKTMVFFTFWGLNLLRGDVENASAPVEKISFFQRVFKWLMPRGPRRPRLGKLDFGGVGTSILGGIMRDKNIQDLPALLASAESQGVSFVACTMSMSVMGIGRRDLAPRPNLSFAGVATFVEAARGAAITLKF